jgi:hypothetical protein
VDKERAYFSENGEWTNQEREFANRAIKNIGLAAWHTLLRVQRSDGNDAFIEATHKIWPNGMPPESS